MSDAKKGEKHPMFGITGEQHYMFGRTHTDDAKEKMSDSHKGDKNHRSKNVYQYDFDGTFLQSFTSSGEAARSLNKKSGSDIRACARGEHKTAYGFKWSYTKL